MKTIYTITTGVLFLVFATKVKAQDASLFDAGATPQLISKQFVITGEPSRLYADTQSVVDFIAGMTDLYAVDLYRKITGMTFPQIR